MAINENIEILLLDEEFESILTEYEARQLKTILQDLIKAYIKNNKKEIKEWLPEKIHEHLPEKTLKENETVVDEIIASIKSAENNMKSLEDGKRDGQTRETWISKQVMNATSGMSQKETIQYLAGLDDALLRSNEAMYKTVTTNAGNINQNPHLDGFIAERQHVETFNLNAEARGSEYRAEVLEPPAGERYGKNSVDIVIKDGDGKIVKRYQSKYCKDAEATDQAFKNGDYRGQQKLVPKDQAEEITSKTTTKIEAPDGTSSEPLSKEEAKNMQEDIQKGEITEYDWNNFSTKDLAMQVGKQAGVACLQGAAIGFGFDIVLKLFNGEEIKPEDEIKIALQSGIDFGLKTTVAAALKIGSEKGILKFIPKGTSASIFANIAFVGIENVKILFKITTVELTPREGMEKMLDVTASTICGLIAMGQASVYGTEAGIMIGGAIGSFFGPTGVIIGVEMGGTICGFIAGTVGYMAGSVVGQAVISAVNKVSELAKDVLESEWNRIEESFRTFAENFFEVLGTIKSVFA